MREHPIPQDITGYRFHIIGSMTLKQFLEVGGGIVFAIIIFKSGIPDVIRWPIIIFSSLLGAAMAFVPFEERPLDHWIITYFSVMFRPTKYFWRREPQIPNYFLYQPSSSQSNPDDEVDLSPARRERIKEYLTSIREPVEGDSYDRAVANRVGGILNQFGDPSLPLAQPSAPTTTPTKPNLEPRVRTMRQQSSVTSEPNPVATTPQEKDVVQPPVRNQILELQPVPIQPESDKPSMSMPIKFDQVAQQVKLIDKPLIDFTASDSDNPKLQEEDAILSQTPIVLQPIANPFSQPSPPQSTSSVGAVFNNTLPFPSTPTQPNKVVGMVLSAKNELVPGAVIEVRDQHGDVARVVKSNALGQFFVTTPLPKGSYSVLVEAPNMVFTPITLSINDTILHPVEIRSS